MYREPYSVAGAPWTRFDDKNFEQALVLFPDDCPDRWLKIAIHMGRSEAQVLQHYDLLLHDVYEIDSGRIDLPAYLDEDCWESAAAGEDSGQISFGGGKGKHGDGERKKGSPWTEEEHKLFLIGLTKYGKGDWRSISRNVVVTRTPTQVASHAQKYFLRQSSVKKERKRSSIHDITNVDSTSPVSIPPFDDHSNRLSRPNASTQRQNHSAQQQFPPAGYLPTHQDGSMGYSIFEFPV